MKIKYCIPALIFLCFIIASCKRVIDLNLGNTTQQLIIEGDLTDQLGVQTVTLSKSVPFDNSNTYPPVSGASVKITDARGVAHVFTETVPGLYTLTPYAGRYNQTYTLQVVTNGQTYTASSQMPNRVNLDSVSIVAQSVGNSNVKTVAVDFQDPANVKNQYRFVMFVNNIQVKTIFVRNDQFSDGKHVQALLYQDDITLKTGDNVSVEMQCIDPTIYTYWYTFSLQQNGFNSTAPSNPPNNFNGSVLGYFSAYTSQRKNVTVP